MAQRDKDYIFFGVIELDDAYLGAPEPNGKMDKASVLVAVSLTEQGHSRFLKIQISQSDANQ